MGTLIGGAPPRVVRLRSGGSMFVNALLSGRIEGPRNSAEVSLVDRLRRAGIITETVRRPLVSLDVTFVVPAKASASDVQRVLDSCGAHPVVVIDDGSTPPLTGLTAAGPLTVLRHEISRGPAAARNAGSAGAGSEWIAFLDADCLPSAGWCEALAAYATESVAVLAPRIRSAGAGTLRTGFDRAMCALDLGPEPAYAGPGRRVSYVPSTALLVRRCAFEAAGGFDEALRTGEDVDLIWRLAREHDVRYLPQVAVAHRPRTLSAALRRRFAYGASAAQISARHPGILRHADVPLIAALPILAALSGHPALVAASVLVAAAAGLRGRLPLSPADRIGVALDGMRQGAAVLAANLTRPLLPVSIAVAAAIPPLRGRIAWLTVAGALCRRRDPRAAAWQLLDDAAYSAGVWAGCLRAGDWTPLVPRVRLSGGRP